MNNNRNITNNIIITSYTSLLSSLTKKIKITIGVYPHSNFQLKFLSFFKFTQKYGRSQDDWKVEHFSANGGYQY
jgi:hypothetical protein